MVDNREQSSLYFHYCIIADRNNTKLHNFFSAKIESLKIEKQTLQKELSELPKTSNNSTKYLELEKKNKQLNDMLGDRMSIGFGSAKRSYVMCPYTLVKDNDSGYETSNVNSVLDGDIGELLEKNIRR